MNNSLEHKLGGSPPMSSFGQAMFKGTPCNRTMYPLTTAEDLAWPSGVNAGTLNIYQYQSGIPSDIKADEYTIWANMTPDGLECQEFTSWNGFEE